jgi:hypothetical protein
VLLRKGCVSHAVKILGTSIWGWRYPGGMCQSRYCHEVKISKIPSHEEAVMSFLQERSLNMEADKTREYSVSSPTFRPKHRTAVKASISPGMIF